MTTRTLGISLLILAIISLRGKFVNKLVLLGGCGLLVFGEILIIFFFYVRAYLYTK